MPIFFKEKKELFPFEIDSIGIDWLQDTIKRPKGYHNYHLLQGQVGQGVVLLNDKEIWINEKDLLLISPNIPHEYHGIGEQPWQTNFVTIQGVGTKTLATFFGFKNYLLIKNSPSQHIQQMFNLVSGQAQQEGENESNLILYDLISYLKYGAHAESTNSRHNPQQLTPVIQYMHTNLGVSINLTELAQQIFVSPQYLIRLFRKYLNCSPNEYLTQLRIQKAKALLVEQPQETISNIGESCGFNSPSYFIKTFKQLTDLTPNQFRKAFKY